MLNKILDSLNNGDKTAVIEENKTYTYSGMRAKISAVLKMLDYETNENVAIFLPNSADYISALIGTWFSGMTAFPLSTQLTFQEVAPLLKQASVRTVLTSQAYRHVFEEGSLFPHPIKIIYMEDLAGAYSYEPLEIRHKSSDEPIILLTTSGTTGSAKIVQLSQKNIETAVFGFISYNDYARFNDVEIKYILGTPFSSVYGILILPVCLINQFPLVIQSGAFTLDTLYSAADKYGVTHYEGGTTIPILMEQMLGKPIPYNIETMRFVGFGGSKVAADILERLSCAFTHIEFCPGYGMTESASLIARPYKKVKENKRSCIGTAIPNVTVSVDVDGIIISTPMTVGELVVKGPNVMLGYYKNEDETNNIVKNGWLYTGDIGYIDEDGDIFISGRKKNVIMVRGFSVYAEEVEASLNSSGLVNDCVIYGEADNRGAETLCADIIPKNYQVRQEDIRSWCSEHLAAYKRPSKIEFVESISKTVTGKIERPAR